jgi:hypothetical protein
MDGIVQSLSSVATLLVVGLGGIAVGTGVPRYVNRRRTRG